MPAIPFLILVFLSATSCIKREFNAKESKATKTTSTKEVKSGAPLDVNDVSILLPPPTTSEDADAYLWLEKDDLLPQPVFDDVVSLYASSASTLFDALKSDETKGTLIPARTAGLAFRDPAESSIFSASLERKHFYVAGVRFDFCAPGRHLVAAPSDCKLQVRLVAHPLWTNFSTDGSEMPANARRPSDDALHVVFEFGNTRSEREVFSKEVAELVAELKEQAAPPTGGEPLGIHPAFRTTSPKAEGVNDLRHRQVEV